MSTMFNSVSSQASATANRADVNSSHGAAGRNAIGGGNDSERSLLKKPPTRIESLINVLQMYNDLSPSDQAQFSEALKLSEASTHSKSNLIFRDEDIKYVTLDTFYDFPRVVLDLAKSKTYFPLTFLTYPGIKRLHAGEDPSTFLPENTISEIEFYQASHKFVDLMSLIAAPSIVEWFKTHKSFCLSHMERYRAVVAFDIETRRRFINTETVLGEEAYLNRWNALEADMFHKELREQMDEPRDIIENSKSDHRFHPYNKTQPGNGHSFCLICGQTGHKASECSEGYTVKEDGVVCEWNGKLVQKSTSKVVCISFNMGRCDREHERVHVCSICGSQGHGAKSCC